MEHSKLLRTITVVGIWIMVSCASNPSTPTASPQPTDLPAQILFDDFSYSSMDEMIANGWIIRSGQGWPGVKGASFRTENVSFIDYPDQPGNRLLRMTSSTDSTRENTFQTQICHQRKYFEGTYAARVRFSDMPITGYDSDQVVETFYMITPYVKALDPNYSEMDFEYLPNGGWGGSATSLYVTTWETTQIEPWIARNVSNGSQDSFMGWHTLVAQATDDTVRYFVDEQLIAQHGGDYYPDAPMSINFNLWFIEGGLNGSSEPREYQEDIDWVYYAADISLMPDDVNLKVNELRNAAVKFQDTVSPGDIPLPSPCDL